MRHAIGVLLSLWIVTGAEALAEGADGAVALTTQEIRDQFSDVRDDAEVQDEEGTRAINYWYGDGTFIVRWRNNSASGEVSGRWWAENDRRCILITSGLLEREGRVACSPVFRRGNVYLSIEPDGRIHGVHTVTPLDE